MSLAVREGGASAGGPPERVTLERVTRSNPVTTPQDSAGFGLRAPLLQYETAIAPR